MKPQSHISAKPRTHRSEDTPFALRPKHPVTDYRYHPNSADLRAPKNRIKLGPPLLSPSFRNLSSDFLATEMKRDYLAEALSFAVIVGVSAWPIVSMVQAMGQLVK